MSNLPTDLQYINIQNLVSHVCEMCMRELLKWRLHLSQFHLSLTRQTIPVYSAEMLQVQLSEELLQRLRARALRSLTASSMLTEEESLVLEWSRCLDSHLKNNMLEARISLT